MTLSISQDLVSGQANGKWLPPKSIIYHKIHRATRVGVILENGAEKNVLPGPFWALNPQIREKRTKQCEKTLR
jgi:hypothetical protein